MREVDKTGKNRIVGGEAEREEGMEDSQVRPVMRGNCIKVWCSSLTDTPDMPVGGWLR